LNLNQFNDLNSDTKSFLSLKINNNIIQDNISVNLDEGLDSKSGKYSNKMNMYTNSKIVSSQSLTNVSNLKNSLTVKENISQKEKKENPLTDIVWDVNTSYKIF